MLSRRDNQYVTQVGPGTPMGNLFRQFWLPALLASELPEPDCAPLRLRLLGEDLVAFRTSSGRPAVLGAYCPHRNANLFWGRNEDEGLRCVYHGWKFDADGACVDMPNPRSAALHGACEPPNSKFAEKIRQPAYQAIDKGGVIWVHMGPTPESAALPDLEWMSVPAAQRCVSKRIQACNWLQNLEGEVDSSHANFLHANLGPNGKPIRSDQRDEDLHPVFSVIDTDYGLAICARREAGPDNYYWRITPFMLPSYTIIPATFAFTAAVPVDDVSMIGITAIWHPTNEVAQRPFVEVDERFYPIQHKGNDYLIDRVAQKTTSYTGIKGIRVQDMAVQQDQRGPISDRTTEHLGASDTGVIATRRRLMSLARDLERGVAPPQPANAAAYRVRSLAMVAERSVPWQDLMAAHMPVRV